MSFSPSPSSSGQSSAWFWSKPAPEATSQDEIIYLITKINNFEFLGDSEEEDDPNYQEASSGEEESSKDDENNARIQESEEKKPTKRDRTKTKQACPENGITMFKSNIPQHLKRQHQAYLQKKYRIPAECLVCGNAMFKSNIPRHLRKNHPLAHQAYLQRKAKGLKASWYKPKLSLDCSVCGKRF